MSKIIDITDKLNFEEKPSVRIKDAVIEVNNDAVTILKVVALFDNEGKGVSVGNILTMYKLLFSKENQKKIEDLKLTIKDFSTLVTEAAQFVVNSGNEGETKTPATT